jgi:uncharacterized protein (DUF433 family)
MATQTLDAHIERTPGVCGGKPRIAGRRLTVQHIAICHERLGRSVDEITAEYDLSLSQVHAALAYYHDHRAEIDRSIEEDEAFIEEMRKQTSSLIEKKLSGRVG